MPVFAGTGNLAVAVVSFISMLCSLNLCLTYLRGQQNGEVHQKFWSLGVLETGLSWGNVHMCFAVASL